MKISKRQFIGVAVLFELLASQGRVSYAVDPAVSTAGMGTVTGVVTSTEGKPLAAIPVAVIKDAPLKKRKPGFVDVSLYAFLGGAGRPEEPEKTKILASGVTDNAGRYTLTNVPPGRFRLSVGDEGTGASSSWIVVVADKTTTANAKIWPPFRPERRMD